MTDSFDLSAADLGLVEDEYDEDALWEKQREIEKAMESKLQQAFESVGAGIESIWVDANMQEGTAEIRVDLYDGMTLEALARLSEVGAVVKETRISGNSSGGLDFETTVRLPESR